MGEAKRKKALRDAAVQSLSQIDIARVAAAVRKLFKAASSNRGVDCCSYAMYGQHLLQRLGVPAEVAIGYASWRVGDGDGDVIAHHPSCVGGYIGTPTSDLEAAPYHAWIDVAGRVVDFTTHDLPRKGAMLDALDGRRTTVTWHPDFLLAEKHDVANGVTQVGQAQHAGVFYYERVPTLETRFLAEARPLEQDLCGMLWMIYQNPDVTVFGPAMTLEEIEAPPR